MEFDAKYQAWSKYRKDGNLSNILKEVKDWMTLEKKLIIVGYFMD